MSCVHSENKALAGRLRGALYDFDPAALRAVLADVMDPDVVVHMCHPFGDMIGPGALFDQCYAPLAVALPDLEARDWIVMAGEDAQGAHWVGCCGQFLGTFVAPWLEIPPTGHLVHMRYHEFYRIDAGRVVEVQAIWDIPEVMMQARAWPMAPSLGREFCVPGPASRDGHVVGPWDGARARASCDHVREMLEHMTRHPVQGGPEVMEMARFWHAKMNWYGPAGIGTARGIAGFRNWHQIPFLRAMPDRGQAGAEMQAHFFGDGDYVAVTGWPNMRQTLTGGGWLGIAAAGQPVALRSLDFWRLETGKIRENWVLVDLLDLYRQLGVDVFARLRDFNKARVPGAVPFPIGEM